MNLSPDYCRTSVFQIWRRHENVWNYFLHFLQWYCWLTKDTCHIPRINEVVGIFLDLNMSLLPVLTKLFISLPLNDLLSYLMPCTNVPSVLWRHCSNYMKWCRDGKWHLNILVISFRMKTSQLQFRRGFVWTRSAKIKRDKTKLTDENTLKYLWG